MLDPALVDLRDVHDHLNDTERSRRRPHPVPAHALAESVPLPAPRAISSSLTAVVRARRSRYDFDPVAPLSLSTLGTLLGTALGLSRLVDAYGDDAHPLGVAPTAGGLRTREVFVFATRVDGLNPGLHVYDMAEHALTSVREMDPEAVLGEVYTQREFATRPAMSIALTARLDVALAKYPPRHYRTVHVDAGIAVQNLYLAATGLGLACCAVSGFSDPAAESALGLDAASIATMMVAVGPSRSAGVQQP